MNLAKKHFLTLGKKLEKTYTQGYNLFWIFLLHSLFLFLSPSVFLRYQIH